MPTKTLVTDLWLYRWRYIIGYTGIIAIIGIVLAIASIYVPGSLRQGEIDSALTSGALSSNSITPQTLVDLPYHLLQRLSFMIFGVTTLSIKLPSIILGYITTIGIFLLVRMWFRRNIAILTTIIAATTTQFLFLIQDGTPSIMYSMVVIWMLFAATRVTRNKSFGTLWKVLTGVLAATALYIPLGAYFVLAVLATAFFHPHIRHVIKHFARSRLIIAIVFGLVAIVPLIYASILDYRVALELLGFPEGNIDIAANLHELGLNLFGFTAVSSGYLLRPVYSLGLLLLIAVGIFKLLTHKYIARSYITLTLSVLMIPLIILNPAHVTDLFPLAVLMIALGIGTLITDWYKLFPRNPYARIGGLLPLGLLVGGIVVSGAMRYMNNYEYNPQLLRNYSSDLRLLDDQLHRQNASLATTRVVAGEQELAFYNLVAHYDKRFAASTDPTTSANTLIVTSAAYQAHKPGIEPQLIITNHFAQNADRFYIYKK